MLGTFLTVVAVLKLSRLKSIVVQRHDKLMQTVAVLLSPEIPSLLFFRILCDTVNVFDHFEILRQRFHADRFSPFIYVLFIVDWLRNALSVFDFDLCTVLLLFLGPAQDSIC